MGGSHYDPGVYTRTYHAAAASGTSFSHTRDIKAGKIAAGVHPELHPIHIAGPTSKLAGQKVHESRDSDLHAVTTPLRIAFDETGSMGSIPVLLQEKMPDIHGLITRKGYLEGLHMSVGAYGDAANGERAPIQLSHFEADNKVDDWLDKLYLEGMGGGNRGETSALVWWVTANYTASDAWDKRRKKGYLFTVGDEVSLPITRKMIETYVDPDHGLEKDPTLEEIVKQCQERWELYHLVIRTPAAIQQDSVSFYTKLLGDDRVVVLEDPASVAETVALLVGMNEGAIDLDAGLKDLDDVGTTGDRAAISKALAPFNKGAAGAVAVAEAPADLELRDDDRGAARL